MPNFVPKIPTACFAPPLSDETLEAYRKTIRGMEHSEVRDSLQKCLDCVEAWWSLPESTRKDGDRYDIVHKGKDHVYTLTPLEKEHVGLLDDYIPWANEIKAIQETFDALPNDGDRKKVRDMAFHLLWYVRELNLDREPLTLDKL